MRLEISLVQYYGWSPGFDFPEKVWKSMEKKFCKEARNTCAICGSRGVRYYEVWDYDDSRRLIILKDFQCLCNDCYGIKHWFTIGEGSSEKQVRSVLKRLTEHFCKVNQCSPNEFITHQLSVHRKITSTDRSNYRVICDEFELDQDMGLWKKCEGH